MGWRRIAACICLLLSILAVSAPALASTTCLLGLVCVEPPPPETITQPITNTVTSTVSNTVDPLLQKLLNTPVDVLEAQMLDLINRDRVAAGEQPLQNQPWAKSVARAFSETLRAAGRLYHNPDYFATGRKAMNAELLGENVGYDSSIPTNHTGFMNSPHHRDNILEARYTHVGIGVAVSDDGRVYVTEDFARITGAPAPAPAKVVAKKTPPKPSAPPPAAVVAPPPPVIEIPTIYLASESIVPPAEPAVSRAEQLRQIVEAGNRKPLGPLVPALIGLGILSLLGSLTLMGKKVGLLGALMGLG